MTHAPPRSASSPSSEEATVSRQNFEGMERVAANHVPLSPLSFLARSRDVFGDREALIYGQRRYTWRHVHDRAARLASGLRRAGVEAGDVVSVIAANTPEMVEAHFGVPRQAPFSIRSTPVSIPRRSPTFLTMPAHAS